VVLAAGPSKPVQVSADELKWEDAGGHQTAEVSGNKKSGPYVFFMRFPAGSDSGWHTHDADLTAVVVSGTVQNYEQGGEADAKPLPPGSWWTQPGKKNHVTKCQPGADCVFLVTSKNGWSFHPMTPEGKPAPAAKAK
jgi:quercetin dioxygenase-like cupin family protein